MQVFGQSGLASAANLYPSLAALGYVSMAEAGVPVDGVTPGASALQAAIADVNARGRILYAKPGDAVLMDKAITIDSAAQFDMRNCLWDFRSFAPSSITNAVTIQPSTSSDRHRRMIGPRMIGSRTVGMNLNGLYLQGTAGAQLQNLALQDWTIQGFRDNVSFGDFVYIISFDNCGMYASVRRGVSVDYGTAPTAAGENFRFDKCNISNHRANGGATAIYVDAGSVNDIKFTNCSIDYSDIGLMHYSGSVTLSGHMELDSNNAMIQVIGNGPTAGANSTPHLHLDEMMFYQPLSAGGSGNIEAVGGRTAGIIAVSGFRASVTGSAVWTRRPSDAGGNVNTPFVSYPNGTAARPHVSVRVREHERNKYPNKISPLGLAAHFLGDFEDGWNQWQGSLPTSHSVDTTNFRSGSKCGKVTLTGSATGAWAYRDFPVNPGNKVRARGYFKADAGATGTCGLKVELLDVNGNSLNSGGIPITAGGYLTPTTTYQQHGDIVDGAYNAKTARVWIQANSFTGALYVDDVEVTIL